MAAHAEAVNGQKAFDDTGAIRLAKIRTDPGIIARRKKLRRVVAYVLAPAAIIAAIAGAKLINGGQDAAARPETSGMASLRPPIRVSVTGTTPNQPTATVTASAATTEPAGDAAAEGGPDATVETADAAAEAPAESAAAGSVPEVPDGVDPKKAAYIALNQGKWETAVSMARAALARDPEDANLYLYEGTALQEMGRRAEAKQVFRTCLEKAKRGPVQECRMFAGPK
jgi:tetratricopeptide (TPR) repeat protein